MPNGSVFDDYRTQLLAMNQEGLSSREMIEELGLRHRPAALTKWFLRNGIERVRKVGGVYGEKNHQWKGGKPRYMKGYKYVYAPDHPNRTGGNMVAEHRLVMEEHLGRYLDKGEVVHHKNGDILDNRIENLELFSSNAEHLAVTLAGNVPNWTEAGWQRMLEALEKGRQVLAGQSSSQSPSRTGVQESLQLNAHPQE